MALKFYNSMTRRKEEFVPLNAPDVGIYVCGLTVYDHCHLGHARMLVAFDVIVRHLRASGYRVRYVRNITDIDDKIIARANENGESIKALTERFIQSINEDCAALGVLPPDVEPRATEAIDAMQKLISTLIDRQRAYVGSNGDVYYAVNSFADYGALSGKDPADLRAGARVDIDPAKRDSLDFVLWKAAKPGEPSWPSPWGDGRPGWHIECSAMSETALGPRFDIHGGGMDLKFPHHENEIAQSRGASDAGFARYWMHNGFVQVDDEKMSKSLGNFFAIRDILTVYRPEEVRLFLLSAHYRKPLNYSQDELNQARANLQRFYLALRDPARAAAPAGEEYTQRFIACMDDDFNTPGALAVLFDLSKAVNRAKDAGDATGASALAGLLRDLGGRLGLLQQDPDSYLQGLGAGETESGLDDAAIEAAINERIEAKLAKNWARADEIRDELKAAGIVLEDSGNQTTWRRG